MRVETATEGVSPDSESAIEKLEQALVEKLQQFKRRAHGLLEKNKIAHELFAESGVPEFAFGDGFYFELDTYTVYTDPTWFVKKGLTDVQYLWAVRHELGHFRDLAMDPEGMKKKFRDGEVKGREIGARLAEKFKASLDGKDKERLDAQLKQKPLNPRDSKRGTMNNFELRGRAIHHGFWNAMDDIYVNSHVAARSPAYARGGVHHKDIVQLYQEVLFQSTDFTKMPLHRQYAYAMLRGVMVPHEKVTVSPEVEEALKKKYRLAGREVTTAEILHDIVECKSSIGRKASIRHAAIENTLEKTFEALLEKDIAAWDPQQPQKPPAQPGSEKGEGDSGEGSEPGEQGDSQSEGESGQSGEGGSDGEPQSGENRSPSSDGGDSDGAPEDGKYDKYFNPERNEGSPSGENESDADSPLMPDSVGDEADFDAVSDRIKKAAKDFQNKQEEKKTKKPETAEEVKKRLKRVRDRQWAEKHSISVETIRDYEKVEREIAPYLESLDMLWRRIVYGESVELMPQQIGHYTSGDLDVEEFIHEIADILGKKEYASARVFTQQQPVFETVIRPDRIRVRLLGDASGSMNDEKMAVLKQVYVLITSSLRSFQAFLNAKRQGQVGKKTKLHVDSEAWVFGTDFMKVKSFNEGNKDDEERAEILRAFSALKNNMGGTMDSPPLEDILGSLSAKDERDIATKKCIEFLFEITDGGTQTKEKTKIAVDALNAKGVITRAFQIGTTTEGEQQIFNEVWNRDSEKPLGEIVGNDIKNLVPAIAKILARYLGDVQTD